MAKNQEIEFIISPEGEVVIKVRGVEGSDCLDLTAELEETLGLVRTREYQSSYYKHKKTDLRQKGMGSSK